MKVFSNACAIALLGALAPFSSALAFDVDGSCSPEDEADALCFVSPGGFVVEAVTGPNGEFPRINDSGNSVFSYQLTGPGVHGGSCQNVHAISHADILIPNCEGGSFTILSSEPVGERLANGDPSCGFGLDDEDTDVFKWDVGVSCNASAIFTVVLEGHVAAEPTSFLLKSSTDCDVAMILGPACSNVTRYCEGNVNSTGDSGSIDWDGSFSISENNFSLLGSGLPPNEPGYFFFGTEQVDVPFGDGIRCIGGDVVRMRKVDIAVNGTTAVQFDLTLPPMDVIVAGSSYYFQMYYRDPGAGGAGFGTTDALCILFTE